MNPWPSLSKTRNASLISSSMSPSWISLIMMKHNHSSFHFVVMQQFFKIEVFVRFDNGQWLWQFMKPELTYTCHQWHVTWVWEHDSIRSLPGHKPNKFIEGDTAISILSQKIWFSSKVTSLIEKRGWVDNWPGIILLKNNTWSISPTSSCSSPSLGDQPKVRITCWLQFPTWTLNICSSTWPS